jgi:hypothetical protein
MAPARALLISMKRMRKRKSPMLGTIAIVESQRLDYLIGPDLALILSRPYFDLRLGEKLSLWQRLKNSFSPRVVSISTDVVVTRARTIYVDSVIQRMLVPEKNEVVRRVLIKMREAVEESDYV